MIRYEAAFSRVSSYFVAGYRSIQVSILSGETTAERVLSARQTKVEGPKLRIEPSKGWIPLRLWELWEYRELIYFLTWRDIKVRYKQTLLGAAWAILQPVSMMLVFTTFFGRMANLSSE